MQIDEPTDALARFRAQDLDAAMADVARKQGLVTPMFDVIAPRYDAFTRLFSFGMDASWKRDLIAATTIHARAARTALDIACGTGDLGIALATALPALRVTGVDPSVEMLRLAGTRTGTDAERRVTYAVGEFAALPSETASVDVITAGYGFRNAPDLDAAIRECARVLRPGGTLGSLDFFLPTNALWRELFLWYLRLAGNLVGWWWHRTPAIYGYIARSIDSFVTSDEFSARLRAHGFVLIESRQMLLGGIGLHIARREVMA